MISVFEALAFSPLEIAPHKTILPFFSRRRLLQKKRHASFVLSLGFFERGENLVIWCGCYSIFFAKNYCTNVTAPLYFQRVTELKR